MFNKNKKDKWTSTFVTVNQLYSERKGFETVSMLTIISQNGDKMCIQMYAIVVLVKVAINYF